MKYFFTGNTSDERLLRTKLRNGNATRLFIDAFKASAIKSVINDIPLYLDEVKHVEASYGIILSGEVKRASKCIKKYIDENNLELLKTLNAVPLDYKVSISEMLNKPPEGLFSVRCSRRCLLCELIIIIAASKI